MHASVSAVIRFHHGAAEFRIPGETRAAVSKGEIAAKAVDLLVVESIPGERACYDGGSIVHTRSTKATRSRSQVHLKIPIANHNLVLRLVESIDGLTSAHPRAGIKGHEIAN